MIIPFYEQWMKEPLKCDYPESSNLACLHELDPLVRETFLQFVEVHSS